MSFLRQLWCDLKDFWKSQLLWGLVLTFLTTAWNIHKGNFSGSIWDAGIPYVGMFALFMVGNVSRTLFIRERNALRRKRREERRNEHKLDRKKNAAPPPPPPNLQIRRAYQSGITTGHELSPSHCEACLAEVGNELANEVSDTRNVRVHLTYKDSSGATIHTECPGFWTAQVHMETIPIGEGRTFGVAFFEGRGWETFLYSAGVSLKGKITIEARFLASDGKILAEVSTFQFQWDGRMGSNPSFKRA